MNQLQIVHEEITYNILSKAEYIYENYGEDAYIEYMDSLTEEEYAIFEETYWQGVRRRAGEVASVADQGAEAIVPYYRAGKRFAKGDYSGAASDAATDTALLAATGGVGKLAGAAYRAYRARKAAKASLEASKNLTRDPSSIAKGLKPTSAVDDVAKKMAEPPKPPTKPFGNASAKPSPTFKPTGRQAATATAVGATGGAVAGDASNKSAEKKSEKPENRFAFPGAKEVLAATSKEKPSNATGKPIPPSSGPPGSSIVPDEKTPPATVSTKPEKPAATAPTEPVKPKPETTVSTKPKKQAATAPTAFKPKAPSRSADTGGVGDIMRASMDTSGTAMGRYGKERQKAMGFREEKATMADFRALQERIMRKSYEPY